MKKRKKRDENEKKSKKSGKNRLFLHLTYIASLYRGRAYMTSEIVRASNTEPSATTTRETLQE